MVQRLLDTGKDRDRVLVDALCRRADGSLEELIRLSERWVRGIVFSVLGDADMVDDVVQEVWLAAWRQVGQLEDSARWRGWLGRLARNSAIDALRRKSCRRKYMERFREFLTARRDSPPPPERSLEIEDEQRVVLKAVSELPEIYRTVFVLRHLEDWNYRQIAEVLSLPVATVETRLVRARRMLRGRLAGRSV